MGYRIQWVQHVEFWTFLNFGRVCKSVTDIGYGNVIFTVVPMKPPKGALENLMWAFQSMYSRKKGAIDNNLGVPPLIMTHPFKAI